MNKALIISSIFVCTLSAGASYHDYDGRPRHAIKKTPAHSHVDKELVAMQLELEKVRFASQREQHRHEEAVAHSSSAKGASHSEGREISNHGTEWTKADLAEIHRQAKAGTTFRQFQMGQANEYGYGGFPINLSTAERWYQMAVDNGAYQAQKSLARIQSKMGY